MNKFLLFIVLFFIPLQSFSQVVQDEVALSLRDKGQVVETHLDYNYESTDKYPVRIKIINDIKTENDLQEGQIVKFKVVKGVIHKGEIIISGGQIINAKVKAIITSGMNGIPASIIFGDFKIDGLSKGQFSESYEVFGQDRSLFVFPLKWALTPLPPTGSLTNFIKGGHAKLKQKKVITIYYYPEWI